MVTSDSHEFQADRNDYESPGDSSKAAHDVRLRPWIGDVITVLIIGQFWYFYGWLAGTAALLIGLGIRRRRIVALARCVHPMGWFCLCGAIVVCAAFIAVKEFREYQAREFRRVVEDAGGLIMGNGGLQFSGPEITNANLIAVVRFTDTESLELHSTRITDDGLEAIEDWTNLRYLFLNNNPLTDKSLEVIGRFEN
ncbi:MAG: leucine-rich repeat domain-containing protein, partial [Planctomycetes bacterium]|nr:leucine-rich repeat domain-containing protein [Planctomycetota bacterium]